MYEGLRQCLVIEMSTSVLDMYISMSRRFLSNALTPDVYMYVYISVTYPYKNKHIRNYSDLALLHTLKVL